MMKKHNEEEYLRSENLQLKASLEEILSVNRALTDSNMELRNMLESKNDDYKYLIDMYTALYLAIDKDAASETLKKAFYLFFQNDND